MKNEGGGRKKSCIVMAVILLILMVSRMDVQAENSEYKRILFISSYSYSWTSVPEQIRGIHEELGNGYILNYEFMDTKNTVYSDDYKEFYELLKYKLSKRQAYDAVIVGDDAALRFMQRYKEELFPEIPVVFEGIDDIDFATEMGEDPYVTGVVEKVDYETNIESARKLLPEASHLVFILDNAENGIGIQKQLEENAPLLKQYDVTYINTSDYTKDELCATFQTFTKDDIVFCVSMSQSKDRAIYTEEERYEMLDDYSDIPMFRVSISGVGDCDVLIGGYVVSHYQSGVIAGNMVEEALSKNDIAKIPVDYDTPSEYYFNWPSLKKYGLDENQIPFEAVLLNMDATFFQKYYVYLILGGGIILLVLLVLMILSYKRSSRRYRQYNLELAEKNEQLAKTSVYKTEFLSNMSHEIRTPMNAIIGMTKLAEDIVEDGEVKDYLNEIDEASQYMLGMLNDVLDMSRIDSGKFELNWSWIPMNDVMVSCIHMMEPVMQAKHISFIYPAMERVSHVEIYTDRLRLKQVLMNLLNNAYKFTPEGGNIKIILENISHDEHRTTERVSIVDDGCGMSEEFMTRIFQPFEQEKNIYSEQIQGTGLGLALVKRILDSMGGTISVQSELGKGTTFTFIISYEYRRREAMTNDKTKQVQTLTDLTDKRVLIVDDHPMNRRIAAALLEKKNMIVEQAESGQKVLDQITASGKIPYDVILMDIRMPGIDGHETTRRIRQLEIEGAKEIPIIAMTANAFEEDVKRSKESGMNAHLAKPIEPEKLYRTLERYL